jgi:hypothetical protein
MNYNDGLKTKSKPVMEVKMKINFRGGVKTFSGYWDDYVYTSCLNRKICIGRDYTYPKLTDNNHAMGKILRNLASVYTKVSPAYMQDLKTYRKRYKEQFGYSRNPFNRTPVPNSMALFVGMMYAWQESDPEHVDLATVTIADIVAMDADVRTIARAIEADYLRKVTVYTDLTSDIQ